ncbi:MAG: hypothetical protein AAGI11_00705 [Pseudomonadota bacterium]
MYKFIVIVISALLVSACRLDVATTPGGGVRADSGKIDCREDQGTCRAWYGGPEAKSEFLEARPDSGYDFVGWSGDCSGSARRCEVNVGALTRDLAVEAHFQPGGGAVVAVTASPGGVVSSSDGQLRCSIDCAASYPAGSRVTLVAEPLPGYRFNGWQGVCANRQQNHCTLNINATRRNLSADFVQSDAAVATFDGIYQVEVDNTGFSFDGFIIRDGRIDGGFFLQVSFILEGVVQDNGDFTFTATSGPCEIEFQGSIDGNAISGDFDASACGRPEGTISGQRVESFEEPDFVNFESGQVRPLALSPDGSRLFVANTPNGTLEIFGVQGGSLSFQHAVPVGLEPVAVAAANNDEVWVVNHLSDSVSIVDVSAAVPSVIRTLQVGDEPRDIVFAGPGRQRAFITTARRGQNTNYPFEEYRTAGLPRADVWVFDRGSDEFALSDQPLTIVNLFGDVPRALATNASGSRVYAAVFMSGNQTTTLFNAPEVDAGKAAPDRDVHGDVQPATGLIVKYDGEAWRDEAGSDWSNRVNLSLPDYDVFTINANAAVPREVSRVSGVGTTLFNMANNPVNDELYVTNLDARNEVRFEGPGTISTTVRGHIANSRVSLISENEMRGAIDLNPHVDYSLPQGDAIPAGQKARSLSQPIGIAVAPDGSELYVAALGSNKVAALPTDVFSQGYTPDRDAQVEIPGGGPTGLVLDAGGRYLYVLARYNNSVVTVDTANLSVTGSRSLANPEPSHVREGRPFLYDANLTSSNGTAACSSCHIFGDVDHLAWDLGNPDDEVVSNPLQFTVTGRPDDGATFHPMKGPMTTQTFRGMTDSGAMHWRGDRTGSNRVQVRGELESVEAAAFKEFNPAFVGLIGRQQELSRSEMQAFTDFALSIMPPPNPLRALDNSLNESQRLGENIYFNQISTGGALTCNDCHTLNPLLKQFGTGGRVSDEGQGITEDFKVPHFRNLYTKVGKFGMSPNVIGSNNRFMGDQVRGFGFLHDGSMDTLDSFFSAPQFNLNSANRRRNAVVDFVIASDSNFAPIVGQQVTLDGSWHYPAAAERLDLMVQRALAVVDRPECDLVARGVVQGEQRAALMREDGFFYVAGSAAAPLSLAAIKQLAKEPGQALTFTCLPPGTGERAALGN